MYFEDHNEAEEAIGWLNDDIKKLKEEIAKENEHTSECQREIDRLRGIVRDYNRVAEKISKPDYEKLFELWADYDDEESPAEVKAQCRSIGPRDGISFIGFCAGFAAAAKLFEEE